MKTPLLTLLVSGFAVASISFASAQSYRSYAGKSAAAQAYGDSADIPQYNDNVITGRSVYEADRNQYDNQIQRYQFYSVPNDATMHGGGH